MRIPRYLFTSRLIVALVLGGSAAVASPADTAVVVPDAAVSGHAPGPAVAAAQTLAALRPAGPGAAGTAARRWVDGLPTAVVDALGYRPVTVDGLPADPAGDCSSPVPLPASFTPACMTHDLGYDLLRVADAAGERIPAGVRPALDRQLASRMAASCPGGPVTGCRLVAGVADAAVTANSVRQGDGAPVKEHWPWT